MEWVDGEANDKDFEIVSESVKESEIEHDVAATAAVAVDEREKTGENDAAKHANAQTVATINNGSLEIKSMNSQVSSYNISQHNADEDTVADDKLEELDVDVNEAELNVNGLEIDDSEAELVIDGLEINGGDDGVIEEPNVDTNANNNGNNNKDDNSDPAPRRSSRQQSNGNNNQDDNSAPAPPRRSSRQRSNGDADATSKSNSKSNDSLPTKKASSRSTPPKTEVTVDGRTFSIVAQKGDGNCLFRSIAVGLGLEGRQAHMAVRAAIIDHASVNWQRFGNMAKKQHEVTTKKDYEEKLRSRGEWGDHSEIVLAADLYEIPIHILNVDRFAVENPSGSTKDPLFLNYDFCKGHYDLLMLISLEEEERMEVN